MSLEDKLNDSLPKKHSDAYYANKELVIGQVCAIGSACLFAWGSSEFTDSKEYISVAATFGDFVGFNAGYVACAYADRRKEFSRIVDFAKYLVRFVGVVGVPAGACYHAVHAYSIYALQTYDFSPEVSASVSHIPATLVFFGVANLLGYLTGIIKGSR